MTKLLLYQINGGQSLKVEGECGYNSVRYWNFCVQIQLWRGQAGDLEGGPWNFGRVLMIVRS